MVTIPHSYPRYPCNFDHGIWHVKPPWYPTPQAHAEPVLQRLLPLHLTRIWMNLIDRSLLQARTQKAIGRSAIGSWSILLWWNFSFADVKGSGVCALPLLTSIFTFSGSLRVRSDGRTGSAWPEDEGDNVGFTLAAIRTIWGCLIYLNFVYHIAKWCRIMWKITTSLSRTGRLLVFPPFSVQIYRSVDPGSRTAADVQARLTDPESPESSREDTAKKGGAIPRLDFFSCPGDGSPFWQKMFWNQFWQHVHHFIYFMVSVSDKVCVGPHFVVTVFTEPDVAWTAGRPSEFAWQRGVRHCMAM